MAMVDHRPLIKDLLEEHASKIEDVKAMIENDDRFKANAAIYDDVWVLRFVLSHKGDATAAGSAARSTMGFREEMKLNDLGDIRHKIPCPRTAPGDVLHPAGAVYVSCFRADDALQHYFPDGSRGTLAIIRPPDVDGGSIASRISAEDYRTVLVLQKEILHQIHDEVTRRTGRLTKNAQVIDMSGWSMRKFSLAFWRKHSAAQRSTELFYPQLVGEVFCVNAPGWFVGLWNKVLKKLVPLGMVERINIMPPSGKMRPEHLERYLRYISRENLPKCYGGLNEEWPLPSPRTMFADKGKETDEK